MIEDPLQDLGNHLLSCEPADAQLAERYRKEVSAMLYRGRGVRPRLQVVCGVVMILMGLASALAVWFFDKEDSSVLRVLCIVGGAYMCVVGTAAAVCAIRRVDPRRYRALWFGMGLLFMVMLALGLLLEAWWIDDAQLRWQLTDVAFVLLGLLSVTTVIHFMEDFHKRTELRLLELEYRIADLAAKARRP